MEYTTKVSGTTLDVSFARTTFNEMNSWVGGLIWGHPDESLFISCGIIDGPVRVKVHLLESAPDRIEDGWEDISEVSFWAESDEPVTIAGIEDFATGSGFALKQRIDFEGKGWYRLRVYAKGRDTMPGEWVQTVLEEYLAEVWKGPQGEPVVYRVGSELGKESVEIYGLGGRQA